jgi:hypothetical protein
LVEQLREVVFSVAPTAMERLVWQELSYEKPRGGAVKRGICQIGVRSGEVRLAFVHGAFLPDPAGLLQGSAKYKRFVPIRSDRDVQSPALRELIEASLRFEPGDGAT